MSCHAIELMRNRRLARAQASSSLAYQLIYFLRKMEFRSNENAFVEIMKQIWSLDTQVLPQLSTCPTPELDLSPKIRTHNAFKL